MRRTMLLAGMLLAGLNAAAQPAGTVTGTVTDEAGFPLPGATVIVVGSEPLNGTSTDGDGRFILKGVPPGRRQFRASYVGFEPFDFREIMVTSGKDVMLHFKLKEQVQTGEEVIVTPASQKERAINEMAVVSVRQISMEEASRFAGGFDDPARLASAMAGAAGGMGTNAISVRGNAPRTVLWRMEGVEIDNPSHFANVVSFGGGGITALSAQLVANSDFYTGAFPAEFGNVLGGIFDIRMREGNRNRRSYTLQAGGIGLDASAEGPFDGGRGSFLANYRYSTLALLTPVLPEDAAGTRYDDLSFKISWQRPETGAFSLWGIGARDFSGQTAERSTSRWTYDQDREEGDTRQGMGAIGASHILALGKRSILENRLSYSGNGLDWALDRLDSSLVFHPQLVVRQQTRKLTWQTALIHTFEKGSLKAGAVLNRRYYDVTMAEAPGTGRPLAYAADERGSIGHAQVYIQGRWAPGAATEWTGGLHSQYNAVSGEVTLEPRGGVRRSLGNGLAVNAGFGRHSQLEMPGVYAARVVTGGTATRPNRSLRMAKASHLVAGVEWKPAPHWRLRAEPYVQLLTDLPVTRDGSFSTLNMDRDWFLNAPLVNKGRGRTTGLDLTAERFLQDGWYMLATGSLYRSEYRTPATGWSPTRFDRRYTANLLGGREWELREGRRFLSLNGRLNLMGGSRIHPVDAAASALARDVVYDESQPFSRSAPRVFYADASLVVRTNHDGYATLFTVQLNNALARREFYGHRWNLRSGAVETQEELLMVPNISWKVEW